MLRLRFHLAVAQMDSAAHNVPPTVLVDTTKKELSMKYSITFAAPSSHFLDTSGTRSTVCFDDAMIFSNQDDALKYLLDHTDDIKQIGSGALPSEIK